MRGLNKTRVLSKLLNMNQLTLEFHFDFYGYKSEGTAFPVELQVQNLANELISCSQLSWYNFSTQINMPVYNFIMKVSIACYFK